MDEKGIREREREELIPDIVKKAIASLHRAIRAKNKVGAGS
jgi:hypothetical protein